MYHYTQADYDNNIGLGTLQLYATEEGVDMFGCNFVEGTTSEWQQVAEPAEDSLKINTSKTKLQDFVKSFPSSIPRPQPSHYPTINKALEWSEKPCIQYCQLFPDKDDAPQKIPAVICGFPEKSQCKEAAATKGDVADFIYACSASTTPPMQCGTDKGFIYVPVLFCGPKVPGSEFTTTVELLEH
jgi:hypothetical protein